MGGSVKTRILTIKLKTEPRYRVGNDVTYKAVLWSISVHNKVILTDIDTLQATQ